jgi:hypothetical protein
LGASNFEDKVNILILTAGTPKKVTRRHTPEDMNPQGLAFW